MPRPNEAQRNNVIGRLETDASCSAIASLQYSTKHNYMTLVLSSTPWSNNDFPKSGRPPVTTQAQNLYILLSGLHKMLIRPSGTVYISVLDGQFVAILTSSIGNNDNNGLNCTGDGLI